jgi:hypothetical protein
MIWNLYSHFLADAQLGIILGVTAHALCGGWQ